MTETPDADDTPEARAAARVAEKNAVPVGMPSALWVLIAGFIGFAASFTLTVEKIDMLIDPHYQPSCNFNPILACGSVMGTQQASVFGFPNPLMGVVAFTIVIVTHSMQQAARVSQKTAFFHLGHLIEWGDTEQIFTSPKDERTQGYITGRFG